MSSQLPSDSDSVHNKLYNMRFVFAGIIFVAFVAQKSLAGFASSFSEGDSGNHGLESTGGGLQGIEALGQSHESLGGSQEAFSSGADHGLGDLSGGGGGGPEIQQGSPVYGGEEHVYTPTKTIVKEEPYQVPIVKKIQVPEPNPVGVPVPQVIKVPVPQPYPVHIKVPQPIHVPIYKLVPQEIEKKVPITVEKLVPVYIEKPVKIIIEKHHPVHVAKPYPVHIPVYKHVFHHTGGKH